MYATSPVSQNIYATTSTTLAKRELYSSKDNIYSTLQANSSKREASSGGKDIHSRSGKDAYSSGGKDVYSRTGKDIYASPSGKDIYASVGKDIYSRTGKDKDIYSRTNKDIYSSSGGRDIYASPHHRIVYSTESPIGTVPTKRKRQMSSALFGSSRRLCTLYVAPERIVWPTSLGAESTAKTYSPSGALLNNHM